MFIKKCSYLALGLAIAASAGCAASDKTGSRPTVRRPTVRKPTVRSTPPSAAAAGSSPLSNNGVGGEIDSQSVDPSLPRLVGEAMARCNLRTAGNPTTSSETLPTRFTHVPWLFQAMTCSEGGWDLTACAGGLVELTSIHTGEQGEIGPYVAVAITQGERLCCIYQYQELPPDSTLCGSTLSPASCGPAYPAIAALSQCNVRLDSDARRGVKAVTLPSTLTDDTLWGPRNAICKEGGYDLSRCAGKPATLVTAHKRIGEGVNGVDYFYSAWVLTQGNRVCCIWETDGRPTPKLMARPCSALKQ